MERSGGIAAFAVARQPCLAAAEHRLRDEIVLGEGQHDMDRAATREHCLGDQDVPPAGERPERLVGGQFIERRGDARREVGLGGPARDEHVA